MKINNLENFLEKTGRGEMAYGCCVTFSDCAVTEVACAAGFDFVWLDGEHGEMNRLTAMHHRDAGRFPCGDGEGGQVVINSRAGSCGHRGFSHEREPTRPLVFASA